MSQLTLYTHPHSRGRNVRWMLEECGADYETVGVPFGEAMKSPEYRAINPDYPVLRVAERVKQGGHNIPEATIRRRFAAGLANLDAYCAAVNHWAVYENTADRPALLAWGENRARHEDIAQAQNADLRASPTAMQRAALAARRIALQTDTAIIQTRDGQPVRIDAAALRQKPCHDMA